MFFLTKTSFILKFNKRQEHSDLSSGSSGSGWKNSIICISVQLVASDQRVTHPLCVKQVVRSSAEQRQLSNCPLSSQRHIYFLCVQPKCRAAGGTVCVCVCVFGQTGLPLHHRTDITAALGVAKKKTSSCSNREAALRGSHLPQV